MSEIATEALQHNSLTGEDIALVVPHQANIRIIQGMANNLHIPMEKVYTNIHKYGNTSSGTTISRVSGTATNRFPTTTPRSTTSGARRLMHSPDSRRSCARVMWRR